MKTAYLVISTNYGDDDKIIMGTYTEYEKALKLILKLLKKESRRQWFTDRFSPYKYQPAYYTIEEIECIA